MSPGRAALRNLALSIDMKYARPVGRRHQPEYQDGRGLRQAFDHQDAGHDRIIGKVPGKVRLVHRHALDADAMILAADVDHAVDQKKRIPMRQQPEDFCNVRDAKSFVAHHLTPSTLPRPRFSQYPSSTPKTIWLLECRPGPRKRPGPAKTGSPLGGKEDAGSGKDPEPA